MKTEIFGKKGETNMAMPFEPLSTEKLKIYFKKIVDANYRPKDVNSCRKKPSEKTTRNKQCCPARILEAWIQREINS